MCKRFLVREPQRSFRRLPLCKQHYLIGNARPGICNSWSIQEILPGRSSSVAPPISSPPLRGALSRLFPSCWATQSTLPVTKIPDGDSRIRLFPTAASAEFLKPAELTGLRKTSITFPFLVTSTMAWRSRAGTHIFPALSNAIPSAPSR